MHVGLFELGSHGHHTPYSARTSRYLVNAGHEVTLVTAHDHDRLDAFPDDPDFAVEQLPPPPIPSSVRERFVPDRIRGAKPKVNDTVQYGRGIRAAERAGVDVLHCPSLEGMEFPLWLAGRDASFPILATVHRDHYEVGLGLDTLNCLGMRAALADGTLSTVFVHAEPMAIRIKASVPSANGRNVRTVPYPTPTPPALDISKAEARDRLDLPPDLPLLLFFGLHTHEKGPDILLDAVREFDRPVGVIFAGGEGVVTSDDLAAFERDDGGEARVIDRIGWIEEEDVHPYFVATDAATLPFRRTIGVSETLNRACLTDTHSIASDDSDVGYMVDRERVGQTFERGSPAALREAIREFLDDRDRYPLPDVEAFGRCQLVDNVGEEFEAAYREAIADRRTRQESVAPGSRVDPSKTISGDFE